MLKCPGQSQLEFSLSFPASACFIPFSYRTQSLASASIIEVDLFSGQCGEASPHGVYI